MDGRKELKERELDTGIQAGGGENKYMHKYMID